MGSYIIEENWKIVQRFYCIFCENGLTIGEKIVVATTNIIFPIEYS